MHFKATAFALLGATALAAAAAAQPAAPAGGPPNMIAAGKLPSVTDAPRYFKVVSVTLAAGQKSSVTGPSGILYQMSGTTSVSLGGETKTLNAGDGIYVAAGTPAQLQAQGPSTLFHFFLSPAADLDRPAETAPAVVKELYRSSAPIPDLKAGPYDINLTRGTFAAQLPLGGPHHRSGAALYYIASGTALNTIVSGSGDAAIDGKTVPRGPGSFVYEPYSLVHRWANPTDEPSLRIVFNINPEGVPAVQQGAPENAQ